MGHRQAINPCGYIMYWWGIAPPFMRKYSVVLRADPMIWLDDALTNSVSCRCCSVFIIMIWWIHTTQSSCCAKSYLTLLCSFGTLYTITQVLPHIFLSTNFYNKYFVLSYIIGLVTTLSYLSKSKVSCGINSNYYGTTHSEKSFFATEDTTLIEMLVALKSTKTIIHLW